MGSGIEFLTLITLVYVAVLAAKKVQTVAMSLCTYKRLMLNLARRAIRVQNGRCFECREGPGDEVISCSSAVLSCVGVAGHDGQFLKMYFTHLYTNTNKFTLSDGALNGSL